MAVRLKFAAITGFVGLVLGLVTAAVVREEGDSFPVFVVAPFVAVFAISGAFSKKEWAESVLEFFYNVLP